MPGEYRLAILPSAKRELEHIHDPLLKRIVNAIGDLRVNPRPHGCRKLEGSECDYRVRVGDYRILYTVNDSGRSVVVFRIRHRGKAYS